MGEFMFDIVFILLLICAVLSIVFSFLSKKNWKGKRTTAILKNAIDYLKQCPNLVESNKCNSNIIPLTDEYFQVKFGGPETEWNGITLRVIIDGLKPHDEIKANIFLGDKKFLIDGDDVLVLNCTSSNDGNDVLVDNLKLKYNAEKDDKEEDDKEEGDKEEGDKEKDNKEKDNKERELSNHDLILIRGKAEQENNAKEDEDKIIASFIFFDAEDEKKVPNNIQIEIENIDSLLTKKDKQHDR